MANPVFVQPTPQFERELIRERQKEGIELAKRAGAYKGRKRVLTPERATERSRRLAEGCDRARVRRGPGDCLQVHRSGVEETGSSAEEGGK